MVTRREMIRNTASAAMAFAVADGPLRAAPNAGHGLAQTAFRALPLGDIRPAGWLKRQLRIQAQGMGGHLDEFWPDVGANSGWLGGTGESWERGPYFLDGLVPLAYLLDDEVLKAKARKFVDWTLDHQQVNGMIGPSTNDDWWPRMVMVKALIQYQEATNDARVVPVLTRYFHYQLAALPQRPLQSWGKYRWQDQAHVVAWLYERTHDEKLVELAALLQRQGFDWEGLFKDFRYTVPTTRAYLEHGLSEEAMRTHGVNNAQGLKTAAVRYRFSGDANERDAFFRQLNALDKYHGMPNGMFSCDEHLGGLEPQHGSELCSVVESMFSLEIALAAFGDAAIADRIEKLAYNALPGTFTDDMWAHQYDQQANQVQVGLLSKPWTTNGPESNLYGLAPHFGCCTANFHQGWPKFAASLWMRTLDDGLVATLFAPCEVNTIVRGQSVHISEATDYPFRNTIRLTVTPARPLLFPLHLRVPGWSAKTVVKVNGLPVQVEASAKGFASLLRTWHPNDEVEMEFEMLPKVSRWYNRSVAVERGPLVFSLSPGETWVKLRDQGPTADWQVYPVKPWNYALDIDEGSAHTMNLKEVAVGERPFGSAEAAVSIQVASCQVDEWRSEDGVAAAPPMSPIKKAEHGTEELTLIPYACAKLRITAFPSLKS